MPAAAVGQATPALHLDAAGEIGRWLGAGQEAQGIAVVGIGSLGYGSEHHRFGMASPEGHWERLALTALAQGDGQTPGDSSRVAVVQEREMPRRRTGEAAEADHGTTGGGTAGDGGDGRGGTGHSAKAWPSACSTTQIGRAHV